MYVHIFIYHLTPKAGTIFCERKCMYIVTEMFPDFLYNYPTPKNAEHFSRNR